MMIEYLVILFMVGLVMVVYGLRSKIFKENNGGKKNMKGFVLFLGIFLISIGIFSAVYIGWTSYLIDKDTTAYMQRAQVSSNPEDMKEYLIACRNGMSKWGVDDGGYATILWVSPENDMSLVVKALDRSISRCDTISAMDVSSQEYQSGLDDLRGQIREINIHSTDRYWTKNFIIFILPELFVIFGMILLFLYFVILRDY